VAAADAEVSITGLAGVLLSAVGIVDPETYKKPAYQIGKGRKRER
jgi:hypothetical protein